ncbi:hypothetical protein [Viridibacillus arvi]|uniref:hypothetical protein n=1 Tax=Viridibacillus arvi TaxID=263475 RepID=UPI003D283161
MRNIESIFSSKTEYFSKVFSNIKFIIFAFSVVSILGFLLVYSFLYGYYFSGNFESKISSFNIISNLIPFDIRTLTMTAFYFICIFYIILGFISLLKGDKKNKKNMIISLLLIAVIITTMLALFFASVISFKSIASFSLIWLFLGSFVWLLFIIINIFFKPIIAMNSSIITFFVWTILIKLLSFLPIEDILFQQLMFILLFVIWPVIITIYIFFEDKNWMIFLIYLSSVGLLMFFVSYLLIQISITLNFWLVLLISILVSVAIYYINKKLKPKNNDTKKNNYDSKEYRRKLTEEIKEEINNENGILYKALELV